MKNFYMVTYSCKRQFKNPFLIVMLVLIPVTAFIISLVPKRKKKADILQGFMLKGLLKMTLPAKSSIIL